MMVLAGEQDLAELNPWDHFFQFQNPWKCNLEELSYISLTWGQMTAVFGYIFLNFFNWRIIALRNFAGFYQASAWISHRCVPSLRSLPPVSLPFHPSRLLQSSGLSSLCLDVFLKHPFWIFGHKYSKLVLKKDKYKIHNLFCCKKSC